tara:strand:+ start:152 stop:292 length:141 start_codon:yes stop_codon:yes gene_type:complete
MTSWKHATMTSMEIALKVKEASHLKEILMTDKMVNKSHCKLAREEL